MAGGSREAVEWEVEDDTVEESCFVGELGEPGERRCSDANDVVGTSEEGPIGGGEGSPLSVRMEALVAMEAKEAVEDEQL